MPCGHINRPDGHIQHFSTPPSAARQHFSLSAPLQTALVAGGFLGRVRCLFIAGEEISQTTEDLFRLLFLYSAEAPGDQRTVPGEELADLDDAFFGQLSSRPCLRLRAIPPRSRAARAHAR